MDRLPAGKNYALVLALMVIAIAFCILPATAVTITDDTGNVVSLDHAPVRIVSLSPANTEILAALGLADRIVGITDVCDFPPDIQNKTRIGGYASVSIEKVAAMQPDLILASDLTPEGTVRRLRDLGFPVAVVAPHSVDSLILDICMVGILTGAKEPAENLSNRLLDRLTTAYSSGSITHNPTVAHVIWHDPLYVSGNNTLQNAAIVRGGCRNVFADRDGWITVSLEEFLARDPEIIIVNGGDGMNWPGKDLIRETLMENPHYATLSAVKNNRVFVVDADIISRPSPRIVDAIERIARFVHPECYTEEIHLPVPVNPVATTPGFAAGGCVQVILLVSIFRWLWNK